MAGSTQSHGSMIVGINVTPLVDITLVLLIIFMVTAKIMVTPAIPMDLPKASQSEEVQVIFSVIVPNTGPILINGIAVTDDQEVLQMAIGARTHDTELRAVINADGNVPHRRVMHVLDLLKRAGMTRVAFGASPVDGTQESAQ